MKLELRYPVDCNLDKLLAAYELVIKKSDVILLDTNMLRPPLFFRNTREKGQKNVVHSENHLCNLAKAADNGVADYDLHALLRNQQKYHTQFVQNITESSEKLYTPSGIICEFENAILYFANIKKNNKRLSLLEDCRRKNQRSVIQFYKNISENISSVLRIVNIVNIVPVKEKAYKINADQQLSYAAFFMLREKSIVTILSSDKHTPQHLDFAAMLLPEQNCKKLYVIGNHLLPDHNIVTADVLWSYEQGNQVMSIEEVFK